MVKPTAEQQAVEKLFPAIAQWVRGYGHVEIGDQEMFGFVVRALGYGGLAFEDDRPSTLAEALYRRRSGTDCHRYADSLPTLSRVISACYSLWNLW
jgi:hypothetical protein